MRNRRRRIPSAKALVRAGVVGAGGLDATASRRRPARAAGHLLRWATATRRSPGCWPCWPTPARPASLSPSSWLRPGGRNLGLRSAWRAAAGGPDQAGRPGPRPARPASRWRLGSGVVSPPGRRRSAEFRRIVPGPRLAPRRRGIPRKSVEFHEKTTAQARAIEVLLGLDEALRQTPPPPWVAPWLGCNRQRGRHTADRADHADPRRRRRRPERNRPAGRSHNLSHETLLGCRSKRGQLEPPRGRDCQGRHVGEGRLPQQIGHLLRRSGWVPTPPIT